MKIVNHELEMLNLKEIAKIVEKLEKRTNSFVNIENYYNLAKEFKKLKVLKIEINNEEINFICKNDSNKEFIKTLTLYKSVTDKVSLSNGYKVLYKHQKIGKTKLAFQKFIISEYEKNNNRKEVKEN
ncbi:MAG: hypothetical protein K2I36_03030 [Ureaplasma sp.]|nr:hypothetical protein [Ureaplasma sp.]MDE7221753.1 hypothetical protein [Ureaplasma sp.]